MSLKSSTSNSLKNIILYAVCYFNSKCVKDLHLISTALMLLFSLGNLGFYYLLIILIMNQLITLALEIDSLVPGGSLFTLTVPDGLGFLLIATVEALHPHRRRKLWCRMVFIPSEVEMSTQFLSLFFCPAMVRHHPGTDLAVNKHSALGGSSSLLWML